MEQRDQHRLNMQLVHLDTHQMMKIVMTMMLVYTLEQLRYTMEKTITVMAHAQVVSVGGVAQVAQMATHAVTTNVRVVGQYVEARARQGVEYAAVGLGMLMGTVVVIVTALMDIHVIRQHIRVRVVGQYVVESVTQTAGYVVTALGMMVGTVVVIVTALMDMYVATTINVHVMV